MASGTDHGSKPKYLDKSLAVHDRVEDLVSLMTLEEKAGQLFHNMIVMGPNGQLSEANDAFKLKSTHDLLTTQLMTHFNLLGAVANPKVVAEWHNRLQKYAVENTRLGIPITISTDPRNHFTDNVGTSFNAGSLSQWPETLGFAALRSPEVVERFADIARQEYLALGIRASLHPQVDLATEPRWARTNATFGEDADLSGELVAAYIRGFQTTTFGHESVSTMTKHFPGGGPQKDGEDPHFDYGKEQVYPGGMFDYHVKPFIKAIEAGTRQMMPYYGKPEGLVVNGEKIEEAAFAFNKQIITDILREKLGYKDGIVCTDWGLITDTQILGQNMPARAWGCEQLSEVERVVKILNAGCDQFGGESRPDLIIEAVKTGLITESRLDVSVRRLLREKFLLGLFDEKRFIDPEAADTIVGKPEWSNEGHEIQKRAFVLLKNDKDTLPVRDLDTRKIYVENIAPLVLTQRNLKIVETASEVSLAIVRLKAPYDPRPGGFEAHFHAGSLEFKKDEIDRQLALFAQIKSANPSAKVIVDLYLDRPAVLTHLAECKDVDALLVNFGGSADALLDVVSFKDGSRPEGKLPFDLPRSMQAVEKSREDVPFDTENPVFRFGDGLFYK